MREAVAYCHPNNVVQQYNILFLIAHTLYASEVTDRADPLIDQ